MFWGGLVQNIIIVYYPTCICIFYPFPYQFEGTQFNALSDTHWKYGLSLILKKIFFQYFRMSLRCVSCKTPNVDHQLPCCAFYIPPTPQLYFSYFPSVGLSQKRASLLSISSLPTILNRRSLRVCQE